MYPSRQKQGGMGLPSAIFLITVLLILVAAIHQLNQTSASAFSRQWLSLQSLYMAETGAQLAATYQLSSAASSPACTNDFIDDLTINNSALSSCKVSVACQQQTMAGDTFFTFTSTGSCGLGADLTQRIVQIRIRL